MNRLQEMALVGAGAALLVLAMLVSESNWVLYVPTLAMVGGVAALGYYNQWTRPSIRDASVWAPALMVGLFVGTSLLWSPVTSISLFECQSFFLLAIATGVCSGTSSQNVTKVLYAVVPLLAVLGVWGGYQHFFQAHLAQAMFSDPNLFSGLLLSACTVLAGVSGDRFYGGRNRLRTRCLIVLMALGVLVAFWARSRGASIALACSVVLVAGALKRALKLPSTVLAVVLGAVLANSVVTVAVKSPGTLIVQSNQPDESLNSRKAMWVSTTQMVLDNPLKGVGFGLWHVAYPRYRTADDTDSAGFRAHNDYLEAIATAGPLGLLGILTIPGLWLLALSRARLVPLEYRWTFAGLGVASGLLCIQALINFIFHQAGVCLWEGVLLGGMHALARPNGHRIPSSTSRCGRLFSAVASASLLLAAAGINYLSLAPALALSSDDSFEIKHMPWVSSEGFLTVLAQANPLASTAYFVLAQKAHLKGGLSHNSLEAQSELRKAFMYYSMAQAREPGQPTILLRKALIMKSFPGLSPAVRVAQTHLFLEQTLQLNPTILPAVKEEVGLLVQQGRYAEARRIVQRAKVATMLARRHYFDELLAEIPLA